MDHEGHIYKMENKYDVRGVESTLKTTWYLIDDDKKGVIIYAPRLNIQKGMIGLTIEEAEIIADELQGLIEVMKT